jgi:hypothetical protein
MQTIMPPALGLANVVNSCSLRSSNHCRAWHTNPRQEQYLPSVLLPYQIGSKLGCSKFKVEKRGSLLADKSSILRAGSCCIKLAGIGWH